MQTGGTNGAETRSTTSELAASEQGASRLRLCATLSDSGISQAVGFSVVFTTNVRYGELE